MAKYGFAQNTEDINDTAMTFHDKKGDESVLKTTDRKGLMTGFLSPHKDR